MKHQILLSLAVIGITVLSGCDKASKENAKRLSELEQQNRIALERQQELEQRLAEQQLVAERDAIERERQRIEDERFALEQVQTADAAAKEAALAEREQELAKREGKLESLENSLAEQQQDVAYRDTLVSGRELELAGREPLEDYDPPAVEALPVADYGMFYDSLASYGSWFSTPNYGYVWQPAVVRNPGWRPYWDGRWVCSNSGWTWMSDEPFGWACYHYGRWALLRGQGWVWIPGDQWAPAWVCWRESGSHIGWAPLPPETMGWRDCTWGNTVETSFGIGSSWFTFVATTSFSSPIRRHCLPIVQNNIFWRQTTNITNIRCRGDRVFVGGPRYENVCRVMGRQVPYYQLDLDHRRRPGRDLMAMRPHAENNQLRIAAPAVGAAWNASLRPLRVRGDLRAAVIDRPTPVAPEVANQFRHRRQQELARAEQELTRLGGRESFQRRRTEELAANQRQADERARQASAQRSATQPQGQARPARPEVGFPRREVRPGAVAGQPATRSARPDSKPEAVPPVREVRPGAVAGQPATRPARPDSKPAA
ncbi:MAG: hypothetical protein K9N23_22835, partial [Akkermansiaceae bacterium]|nr:hypothetical protein [Akkermansiaceae bacterium]